MRSFMLRLAGFAGAPILSAFAPFLVLPVVSRLVGAEGWGNFSAGQAIGVLGMVGVLFGWSVAGPVRVARSATEHERWVILAESLRSRALTALLAVPAAALITFAVTSDAYRLESVAIAIAMTLGGLTPAWFCIGEGNPRALMLFDAGPKLAAAALALPIMLVTGGVLVYPVALVALTIPTVVVHAVLVARGHDPAGEPARDVMAVLTTLLPTAAIDATGNAYGTTPVPIATAGLDAASASAFASADRMYRIGLLAVVAVGNAFQAWVLDPEATDRARRHRLAFLALGAVGVLGGVSIALLGPWATGLVFGADVAAEPVPCALFGAAFLFLSCSTPLIRNLLIPEHRYRMVLASTITAAVVGLSVMLLGAWADSATVIAAGVAAAEATTFAALIVPALRIYRESRVA